MKYFHFKGLLMAFFLLLTAALSAQRITGSVIDADTKEVLPGATIMVKNANRGTVTDKDGNFSLEAQPGDLLAISFVGYTSQDVAVGNGPLDIRMSVGNELREVVVTSLGINKEKASLGYATQ